MRLVNTNNELEQLTKIINTSLWPISQNLGTVDGFRTIKNTRVPINKLTSRFDVVTLGPSGNRYNWSYERTLPHKVTTKNVDSIRNQLNK